MLRGQAFYVSHHGDDGGDFPLENELDLKMELDGLCSAAGAVDAEADERIWDMLPQLSSGVCTCSDQSGFLTDDMVLVPVNEIAGTIKFIIYENRRKYPFPVQNQRAHIGGGQSLRISFCANAGERRRWENKSGSFP